MISTIESRYYFEDSSPRKHPGLQYNKWKEEKETLYQEGSEGILVQQFCLLQSHLPSSNSPKLPVSAETQLHHKINHPMIF